MIESNITPALLSPKPRIFAIDFWRGVALLMIFINHVPNNPLTFFTSRIWGFSDAAETFMFLAGYSAWVATAHKFELGGFYCGFATVISRVWRLFTAHVLMVFSLCLLVAIAGDFVGSTPVLAQFNFLPFFTETEQAIMKIVKLRYMPNMTDILPLYIIFVASLIALCPLMRCVPHVVLVCSFSLWFWANLTDMKINSYPSGTSWFMNPVAWQFLFVLGLYFSRFRDVVKPIFNTRWFFWLVAGYLLFAVVAVAPWTFWGGALADIRLINPEILAFNIKGNISAMRMLHFLALAYMATRLWPNDAPFWKNKIVQYISCCGRHSLPVYCVGVVGALTAHIVIYLTDSGRMGALITDIVGLAALVALAWLLDYSKAAMKRDKQVCQSIVSS